MINVCYLPSYQELFGDVDCCTCEDCRSIFSPAAYFVDLMSLQAQYIEVDIETKPAYLLENRRPDLWHLPLSCENTNTQISKLIIVNEILEYQYQHLTKIKINDNLQDAVFSDLTAKTYPFNLPFDLPLTQINQYLTQNKSSLANI